MPNDGYTLLAVKTELEQRLVGGRVSKILQPEPDEVHLVIYGGGGTNYRLLLSANPVSPRVHLTEHAKENPQAAPAFCMTLRKHLAGSTLTAVKQENMERILTLDFTGVNELYDTETRSLILEIMGKHSNLILVNGAGKILAANRVVPLDMSSVRQVMPGLTYRVAETQHKAAVTDRAELSLRLSAFPGGNAGKFLADCVIGLSRQTAEEIVYRALGGVNAPALSARDIERIVDLAEKFYNASANLDITPCITRNAEGKPLDFFLFPYETQTQNTERFPTINAAIDACFYLKDKHQRFADRSRHLAAALKNAIARCERKLAGQRALIEDSKNYEKWRIFGELLTANLYRVKRGETELAAQNYYEDGAEVVIPLDKNLSPSENAQRYYKKYAKQKRAFAMTTVQERALSAHTDYLYTIAESFENCTESAELADIAAELAAAGVVKDTSPKRKKSVSASKPLHLTQDGYDIFVGKNNLQNDALTKDARPQDVWMHASKIHGSHVVVANPGGGSLPESVLLRAARLAAYYSKARASGKVPVDYTLKKYVKKPSGAAPGFVIYTDQTTLLVEPEGAEK